jgi:heat shock protein HtpX
MSQARTALFLLCLTALLMGTGLLLDAGAGGLMMLGAAGLFNGVVYWHSAAIALRVHEAEPADPKRHARLIALVGNLAHKAGIPTPGVFVADTGEANAFATGRSPAHAIIVVTTDLLGLLRRDELAGVIAHELVHIRARDSLTMTVTATIAGAVAVVGALLLIVGKLARGGAAVAAVIFGSMALISAVLAQLAIGRGREYAADRQAAELCGTPQGLIRALERLAHFNAMAVPVLHPFRLATASMMFCSPLGDDWLSALFETHPSIERRIARLKTIIRK